MNTICEHCKHCGLPIEQYENGWLHTNMMLTCWSATGFKHPTGFQQPRRTDCAEPIIKEILVPHGKGE